MYLTRLTSQELFFILPTSWSNIKVSNEKGKLSLILINQIYCTHARSFSYIKSMTCLSHYPKNLKSFSFTPRKYQKFYRRLASPRSDLITIELLVICTCYSVLEGDLPEATAAVLSRTLVWLFHSHIHEWARMLHNHYCEADNSRTSTARNKRQWRWGIKSKHSGMYVVYTKGDRL